MVDRLTKSAHFLPIRLSNLVKDLGVVYVCEIVRLYEGSVSIVSDRDSRFTLLFQKGMQTALGFDLRFSTIFHP